MTGKRILAVFALVVGVSLLGTGLVFATDVGDSVADAALGEEQVAPYEPAPGERGNSETAANRTYDFSIESIEECGTTCRDVTAALTNTGDVARSDVVVETRIYADDDLLWRGNATAGSLAVNETYESSARVDLGYRDSATVKRNDGYVTIQTIVHSAEGRKLYEERRQVA
ncbi:hypothetical protein [Halomarina litorea]|uniref:hypothetical protein n=1 Tax=Halomarina litorea TaxID=2961595 RepID=UPI0020C4E718|nr:hypothetical protein [Halomarina sp. BCD28]